MDQYKNQILDQQKLYYNSYLKVKDNPRYKKARKFILDNSYGNERILDIGCADGDFSACLVEKGFDCYGLEIMEDGIRKAREKKIKIIDGSFLDKFPFPDNHFDFVFAGEVIEHTFDDFFFLEEIYRILKPGGVLILTTPNLVSLGNRLLMLFGKLPRFAYNEFHYRIYNLNLVISKMRQVNFQIIGYNSSYVLISSLFNKFIGMVGEWLGSLVPKLG